MKATHSSRPKRQIFKCRLHRLLIYHEEQSFTDGKNYSCFLGLLGGLKILMKITQPRPWHTAAAQPWWTPAARFTPTLPPLKTVARQAPLFTGVSRQEYWSGLPFPFSRASSWCKDRTNVSCAAGRFFTHLSHQGSLLSHKWMWLVIYFLQILHLYTSEMMFQIQSLKLV